MLYAIFISIVLVASCFSLLQIILRGRRLMQLDREHAARILAEFDAVVVRTAPRGIKDELTAAGFPEAVIRRALELAKEEG